MKVHELVQVMKTLKDLLACLLPDHTPIPPRLPHLSITRLPTLSVFMPMKSVEESFCQMKSYSLSSNLCLYLAQVSSLGRLYNVSQKVPLVSVGALCGLLMKFYLLCIFSTEDRAGAEMPQ